MPLTNLQENLSLAKLGSLGHISVPASYLGQSSHLRETNISQVERHLIPGVSICNWEVHFDWLTAVKTLKKTELKWDLGNIKVSLRNI